MRAIKGLDSILERIKSDPSDVLVNRYLALVAEVAVPADKQARTCQLAEALLAKRPSEALRVALMAHQANRKELRPIDIMIRAFEGKGRYGKAEVLRNERAKLVKEGASDRGADAAEPPAVSRRAPDPEPIRPAAPVLPFPDLDAIPDMRDLADPPYFRMDPSDPPPAPPVMADPLAAAAKSFPLHDDASDGHTRAAFTPGGMDGEADDEMSALSLLFQDPTPDPAQKIARRPAEEPPIFPFPSPPPNLGRERIGFDEPPVASLRLDDEGTNELTMALPAEPDSYQPPKSYRPAYEHQPEPAPAKSAKRASADQSAPMRSDAPRAGASEAAELFDHYWRNGRYSEARDLLHQTAGPCAHEVWWQARRVAMELVDRHPVGRNRRRGTGDRRQDSEPESEERNDAAAALAAPAEPVAAGGLKIRRDGEESAAAKRADDETRVAVAPTGEESPLASEAFWHPLYAELTRLAQDAEFTPPVAPAEQVACAVRLREAFARHPLARGLDPRLLAALVRFGGAHAGAPAAKLRALYWDLFVALWGPSPDGACAEALEVLSLTRLDAGFLGLYLDALIAAGRARRALAQAREALELEPHLPLARVIARRLPAVWQALGTHGFRWTEDDGVVALQQRLARRQNARLAAMVLVGEDEAKAS